MANGKGDTPRPLSVPREEYESAWARTFGAEKPEHVCGAQGFQRGGLESLNDRCPACEYADDEDDEPILCDACGDECPGTSECNSCLATLCENCAAEYDDSCSLCWNDDEHMQ